MQAAEAAKREELLWKLILGKRADDEAERLEEERLEAAAAAERRAYINAEAAARVAKAKRLE